MLFRMEQENDLFPIYDKTNDIFLGHPVYYIEK